MKTLLTLFLVVSFSLGLFGQTLVSTTPENKKAFLEEFTGTGCPNCPAGHTLAANLLTANPGKLVVIAYHPANSSYTSSDPMARAYASAFYSTPFVSVSSRFMPSAMVNRRQWGGGDRIQSTSEWTSKVAAIIGEPSPLNVGFTSSYNESTKSLSITAEVYFTSTVANNLTVYCMLLENGIIAQQSGGTSPYTHNHVFREAMVAQWGDPLPTPYDLGTTTPLTFTYDNTTTNYDMTKSEVVVFIRDVSNGEVISGNIAPVNESSPISIENNIPAMPEVVVYPNPATDEALVSLTLTSAQPVTIKVSNLAGQVISTNDHGTLEAGRHLLQIDRQVRQNPGLYLVSVESSNTVVVKKLVVK